MPPVTASESHQIREGLGDHNAVEQILQRAAQVLGVLTKELGVAVGPTLDAAVLDRVELWQASSERLLLVLTLKSGDSIRAKKMRRKGDWIVAEGLDGRVEEIRESEVVRISRAGGIALP